MAQQALSAGSSVPRRRVLFGLLDGDGWAWASLKAFLWLLIIIFALGYLPDRAYYFTVGRTVDLGVMVWAPINLCPPTNESLPCPPPTGSVIPWQPSPDELRLPAGRTGGSVIQIGTTLLYIGGSDGQTAVDTTYVSTTVGTGNFDKWSEGPKLPAPRAGASVAFVAGNIYVIGGRDAAGVPTDTIFVLNPDPTTGALETVDPETGDLVGWVESDLKLPEGRADAAGVVSPTGLLLIGGSNADGPVATDLEVRTDHSRRSRRVGRRGAPRLPADQRAGRGHRRLRVAVRRQRCERCCRRGPARRVRSPGDRGPAGQPR